jgi:hypothetical protein
MKSISASDARLHELASKENYHKRMMVQLAEWVNGRPIHNPVDNECVPDFSCCRGRAHMASERLRQMFIDHPESRQSMQKDWIEQYLAEDRLGALSHDLPGVVVMELKPGTRK